MADNVNGKKIKELPLAAEISDADDFVVEDSTPITKRTKWATIVDKLKNAFEIDMMRTQLDNMSNIHVTDDVLYMPSSAASVNNSTLCIGIGGQNEDEH